ncbi:MAG: M20/M25/M40 family metallo-hydrolase [Acidimicrobiaceae bacterium]|nr:M20/M25/M40 family metallo-hydrolase [Acidimicrobiaceae bacterium]
MSQANREALVSAEEVVAMISDLVRIESVTPWLVEGGAGEAEVVRYFANWVADLGVETEIHEIEPGRVNFIATLRGSGAGPTLLLNAHSDTVGYAGWPDSALLPRLDGDRLYGLGAADDKGCCAIALLTLRHLARSGAALRGDLVVACVADEEGVSIGTEHLVTTMTPDYAIVIEADALPKVVVEHQGFGWLDVVVEGRAAHGSAPEQGIDAIVGLAEIVKLMHEWDLEHFAGVPTPRNGRTVFHTGTVRGGTDYATYPSQAVLGIEIGTQPGETMADRVCEIEDIIEVVAKKMPGLRGEVRIRLEREPFLAQGHEALLESLNRAARRHMGTDLEPVGMNAWTDAALMQAAGTPTVMLGPLGGNFHSPDEWVSIPDVIATVGILVDAARELLS